MARETGTFTFPANLEVQAAAPLDARVATGLKSDLTGLPFPYKGMVVAVTDDPLSANNGVYVLNDADGTVLSNWSKVTGDDVKVSSISFESDILTITMSDGTQHTVIIQTSTASITEPTGATGSSTVNRTVAGVQGTLSFNSNSGR